MKGDKTTPGQDCKVILTEMQQIMVKQHKDMGIQKAYQECFVLLTKHYYEQSEDDKQIREFLVTSYKQMLDKFLGGRVPSSSGLNSHFFQQVFEQCPTLGWSLIKVILRCFLAKSKAKKDDEGANDDKEVADKEDQDGSRSNRQRLIAIELC